MVKLIKRLLIIAAIGGGFVGLTVYAARQKTFFPPAPVAHDYGPAPDFKLDTLSHADLNGGPVLITFFASWCAPCKLEHPVLLRLSKKIPVWGIDTMDAPEDAARYLKAAGNPFVKMGHDPTGTAGIAWGVTGIPASFIIGANGQIIYRHMGPITIRDADDEILPLMRQTP